MGMDLLEIGVKMGKVIIFTVKGCYRSVCNHPFIVGMLCFLIFLYRTCPVIFSLLVSASPVLVCTAVLLGTLLSFGQPNLPEIEIEEKTTHEANATVVEKNESCYVERYSESKRDEPERANSSYGKEISREVGLDDTAPLIEERSREVELDGGDLRYEHRTESREERFSDGDVRESKYASIANMDDDDDEKAETESFDSERVNVDSLDSPPQSPWTRIQEREEDDDVSDSESDGAESSSPDSSMADIMPMLDELHPLLDENAPQPVPTSRDGSPRSNIDGHDDSDDGSENHDNLDGPDDDNDDEEDKEEPTKSVITWTEEDQKNLMDLGCSEIERNIRLENLIMRRRARKNNGLIHERNLIDLESSPFNIAPITTRRQNPFDSPHDAYDENLPPIPGSAPSILLPRRNPFDIPYDSSEEKPDLKGDGFQEEFTRNQTRDSFFRRHESFNLRPSIFAPNRRDVRMRPYFVPEGTVSEESSYSFQRQSSELSDYSKVSSVPETESIGSVEDLEERNLDEEQNLDVGPETKVESEAGPSRDLELISQEEEDYEDLSIVEEKREFVAEEQPEISSQTFVTSIDQSIASTSVNEVLHMEPVYDLSPRELSKNFSSSSISSDLIVEPSIVDPDEHESQPLDVPSSRADENIQVSEPQLDYQLTEEYSVINETVQSQKFDADADNESNEKLVSASSEEENSSFIFDNAIDEPNLKHVNEVEVSNTSAELLEDVRIQNVNMSEIQELDRDISFNINSPLSPDFITIPSTSSEKITSRVGFQTTVIEESNDITEIDEGLLTELDTVGDFSISTSNVFAEHTDYVEVNKIENQIHTENSGMAEVEARTVEEIDSAFKQLSNKEIDKPILWDPPQSDLASVMGPAHETSTLELGPIEEAQGTSLKLHGEEPVTSESTFLPLDNTVDVKAEEEMKPTSDDVSLEIEAQGISSNLLVKQPVHMESTNLPLDEVKPNSDYVFEESKKYTEISAVSEGSSSELLVEEHVSNVNTNLPSEYVLDGNLLDQVTTNCDDVSLEISKDEEIRAVEFERPEQKVEAQGTSSELLVEEAVPREITNLPLEEVIDGDMGKHVKPISDDVFEHTKLKIEQEQISKESTDLPAEEVVDGNTENKVNPYYDDQSVEIKKDEEISTVGYEQAELKGDSSQLLVAEPGSIESTNLPLEEAIDGDTEKMVKPRTEELSLEIMKNREISTVEFEKPEHIEKPVPRESTNLPSKEVEDGNRENQVKLNSDDPKHKIEEPQDLHLASSVKGKGKLSKSSSSSSSSSSESSSDSDRE